MNSFWGSAGREVVIRIAASNKGADPTTPARTDLAETRSVASEDPDDVNGMWAGKATQLHLRAADAETRLLWVTMLERAKRLGG